jgi:hypothetical protein
MSEEPTTLASGKDINKFSYSQENTGGVIGGTLTPHRTDFTEERFCGGSGLAGPITVGNIRGVSNDEFLESISPGGISPIIDSKKKATICLEDEDRQLRNNDNPIK